MKRGYNIDNGIDKPEELNFPANPKTDDHRCQGGGVNSLSWALASSHNSYNPKKIDRSDIEHEISNIYNEIIKKNIDYIQKNISHEALSIWISSNKLTGELREFMSDIFKASYLQEFEANYKGYVADDSFYKIIEQGLDNIKIPDQISVNFAIDKMSDKEIYRSIADGSLTLIHLDKEHGYDSTINYLSKLPGREKLVPTLFNQAIRDKTSQPAHNVLSFLSRSNLAPEYKELRLATINNIPVRLNDIVLLNREEVKTLCTSNFNNFLSISKFIQTPHSIDYTNLFILLLNDTFNASSGLEVL
jgi:hypothetical protein